MTLDDDDVVRFTADEEAELQADSKLRDLAAAGDRHAELLLQLTDCVRAGFWPIE